MFQAFIEDIKAKQAGSENKIIGQFGVGFYSAFMVGEKVEVFSRASDETQGYKWSSSG